MQFRITEHYARGEEKLIAEFGELRDARIFTSKKLSLVDEEGKKIIYRVYHDSELLYEFNKDIPIAYANYADGNRDISRSASFHFSVLFKTIDSVEKIDLAHFNDESDAYLFIMNKCDVDSTINDNDLFLLFKEQNLIDQLNKIINTSRKKTSARSQSNEKGAAFRPTPLSSRPKPPGSSGDYWIEDNNDEEY